MKIIKLIIIRKLILLVFVVVLIGKLKEDYLFKFLISVLIVIRIILN